MGVSTFSAEVHHPPRCEKPKETEGVKSDYWLFG